MASLSSNLPFSIRAFDNLGVGGMYITVEGIEDPVRLLPQDPPFVNRQMLVPGENGGTYYILPDYDSQYPPPRMGPKVEEPPKPDYPVLFGEHSLFHITPADHTGVPNTYHIRVDTHLVSVQFLVDHNKDTRRAFVQPFPIDIPVEELPVWEMKPQN
ncbi:peptidase inhibitor clitocypin domain-containing protein [Ceratobasidium sp. AG-Ba]|nr:peptidase inhibitor clitocypin domain-containing protein [Ceratobasidium sp. AG-Ba]